MNSVPYLAPSRLTWPSTRSRPVPLSSPSWIGKARGARTPITKSTTSLTLFQGAWTGTSRVRTLMPSGMMNESPGWYTFSSTR